MTALFTNRIGVLAALALFVATAANVHAQAPAAPAPVPAAPKSDVPPGPPQSVEPGYLGLVTDDRQEGGKGVRVMEVVGGSPAEKAGLKVGDLITAVDGKAVHGNTDMGGVIGSLPPGSQVVFDIERSGQTQKLNVTLGARPPVGERRFEQFGPVEEALPPPSSGSQEAADPTASGPPIAGGPRPVPRAGATDRPRVEATRRLILGVRTQPVTEEISRRLRLPAASGALVVSRTPGSAAEKAGIPLDAVIVAIDGTPVESPLDLSRLLSQTGRNAPVEVSYIVDGETRRTKVGLAESTGSGPIAAPNTPLPIAPAPSSMARTPLLDRILPPKDDRAEIEALSRRVQELEQRVRELEQAAKK